MTGYGKVSETYNQRLITVEIKTLNSKQADLYIKTPAAYREVENEIRSFLIGNLVRGKIEASIWYEHALADKSLTLNRQVIVGYLEQLRMLKDEIPLPDMEALLPAILRLPEVFSVQKQEFDPAEWELIMRLLQDAAQKVDQFRIQEGEAMKRDFRIRIGNIKQLLNEVERFEGTRKENLLNRLDQAIQDIRQKTEVDPNRFEQELIYYMERLDITEEKVRLLNHCEYFMETMDQDPMAGRKLGFIAQEIGREINTMGSKANHSDIQRNVVLMKDELEKIKEQSFNVL